MTGKNKRIFIYSLSCVTFTIALIAAFIYFSVDDRVKIETAVPAFSNNQIVERLDSIALRPDSISEFITSLMEKAGITGLGVSIINRNAVVYQQYFGMADNRRREPLKPGMIWYGASLSKLIFADIVLQLVEEHVLALDTPLFRYLPKPVFAYKTSRIQQLFGANYIDYTGLEDDERFKKITARMCLSHTAGFPNWRWIESDGRLKIKFEPGSRYSYSGEGMFLLQFVIEQITGRNFEDIAFEKVFKPLGMTRSSYVWQREYDANYARGHDKNGNDLGIPKSNVPYAAGSLSTTLEDVSRY
ncbi:MAG TPA: serine hydrolase domain-containing protein, partial [Chryseosolibacter sp.]